MQMKYDLEKYRGKRERVLGVKKRGLNFGAVATIVSLVIILGLGSLVLPKTMAFFSSRHLDDAIFKAADGQLWSADILSSIEELHGVRKVSLDSNGRRVIVTFDRQSADTGIITAFFQQRGLKPVLLNHVGHSGRHAVLEKESAF